MLLWRLCWQILELTLAPDSVMIAYRSSFALLVIPLDVAVVTHAGAPTYLALDSSTVMLAYLRPSMLLELALLALVVADACAPAYLSINPATVMLADQQSTTFFSLVFDSLTPATVVVDDAGTPAHLAGSCSHITNPLHSFYWLFLLFWCQMPAPLQTLAPFVVMLAYWRPSALLALVLAVVVGAETYAPAHLALAPPAIMLAYRRSTTLFALAFDSLVRRPRIPCTDT